jgi:hypothetical protein
MWQMHGETEFPTLLQSIEIKQPPMASDFHAAHHDSRLENSKVQ